MNLADFLLARIAEDEERTLAASEVDGGVLVHDGVILARGGFAAIRSDHPEEDVVDLTDGLVLPGFVDSMMVYDSAVHEIDAISYFLDEPVTEVQTVLPVPGPRAADGQHDPMILIFRTASGRIVTDELYVNTASGYEVRTEVLGSSGIASCGRSRSRSR